MNHPSLMNFSNSQKLGKSQANVTTVMFTLPSGALGNEKSVLEEKNVDIPSDISQTLAQIDRDFQFIAVNDVGPIVAYL